MGAGINLTAKVFLEGIEVPFIGATITSTINQATIAYIDMVPHKTINQIKPKTLVHIFIRDFSVPGGDNPYVLMYEGEVFGFNFGKTTSSRSFSISCSDLSNYWDNALLYFFNAELSLAKGADALAGVGMDEEDRRRMGLLQKAVTHSTSSFFIQILKQYSGKGFLAGFVGVYKEITKVNSFYKLANDRLRLNDRIVLQSSGAIEQLLEEKEGMDWFQGVANGFSGYSTLRMVIQELSGIIFHDFVSPIFPSRLENNTLTVDKGLQAGKSPAKTIGQFLFKPNMYMLPPPACNVFYPDEYSSFNYSRSFFREPTRLIYQPELPAGFTGGAVNLPHSYAPESFKHFMYGQGPMPASLKGSGDVLVDEDYGHFADPDNSEAKAANNGVKREGQFLTNEEKARGILLSVEKMVPASSKFRASLKNAGRRNFIDKVATYLFYKKRFQTREIQITSHLKPSVLPGFTCLILDDSDAEQNIIAYCSSITHRIYATQGGYTNVTLSYARTVEEEDVASGEQQEPLIPPWFSADIAGKIINGELQSGTKLGSFYKALIGDYAYQPITDLTRKKTMREAVKALVSAYRKQKSKGNRDAVRKLIADVTRRDYVQMRETFSFLGATTATRDLTSPWLEFKGKRLAGEGYADSKQITQRRNVVTKYRNELRSKRGFRG